MPVLTMTFEAGTTGEVEFICPFFRFDLDGEEISAPFNQVEPIVDNEVVVELPSGVDPDVNPNPWSYTVLIRVDGQNEFKAYAEMPMTAANFVDIFNPTQPSTPEYYVLKSEFLAHVDEVGGGGGGLTEAEVEEIADDAVAAHAGAANPHPVYLTQAEADALYEATGSIATAITAHSGATDPHGDRAFTTAAVSTHSAATDPHGDRAFATAADVTAISTHSGAADPHGDRAFTTAAVSTHAGATDPHGDRAYSDGTLATHAAAADPHTGYLKESDAATTYAPLADAPLTGNPTAPTQTVGNNSTRLATTAFVQTASGLLVPKSLFTGKGVLAIATAADTPAAHAAPSTGQFMVGDTAQADGWTNRVLATADIPTFPKGTMSVGAKAVSSGAGGTTIMGLTADTNPGTTVSQTHAFHSDSSNRSRMTIPSGLDGDYLCLFAFNLGGTDATGSRRARLLKDGSVLATLVSPDAPAAIAAIETAAYMAVGLTAGQYLEVDVFQDSGGALNFTMSSFTIIRIP